MRTFEQILTEAMGRTLMSGLPMSPTPVHKRHSFSPEPKKTEPEPKADNPNRSPPPKFGGRKMRHTFSSLNESKRDGAHLDCGAFVYFLRSKDNSGYLDLVVEHRKFGKKMFRDFGWYTEGYDQHEQGGSTQKFYLKTDSGYSAGNGGGHLKKVIPRIDYERGLADNLERFIEDRLGSLL
jgi:hypothetical protein